MARVVEFEDGFSSLTEPTEGFVSASSLLIFDSDADYVDAKGEPAAEGDIYYNSTLKQVRTFNGTNWRGSGVVTVISSSPWVAAKNLGAELVTENGVEVFLFSFENNQKIQKTVPIPENYPGGPIALTLPIYSPSTSNAVRFKLTAILVNSGDPVSSRDNKNEIEFAIELSGPSDKLVNQQVFLTTNGLVNSVQALAKGKFILELERINTDPMEEGAEDTEPVRIFKYTEEFIYE